MNCFSALLVLKHIHEITTITLNTSNLKKTGGHIFQEHCDKNAWLDKISCRFVRLSNKVLVKQENAAHKCNLSTKPAQQKVGRRSKSGWDARWLPCLWTRQEQTWDGLNAWEEYMKEWSIRIQNTNIFKTRYERNHTNMLRKRYGWNHTNILKTDMGGTWDQQ